MINPPTPLDIPPPDGAVYHQYVLAVETKTWKNYTPDEQCNLLASNFGLLGILLMEVVRDDDEWIAFHLVKPEPA